MKPKTVTISEDEYAGLMAQASFMRAALHALGGVYEVTFEALALHGRGTMEMHGHEDRRTVSVKLVQGPHEQAPEPPPKCLETSEEVASSAAKILARPSSTKMEKAVAASALTQRGRKRITERPRVETDD